MLADCDPASAARLASGDTQRIARALEVYEATGKPLSAWQAEAPIGPDPDWRFSTPSRRPGETNAAIEQRFDKMINAGALEEVRTIADLDVELPALKALGVPHLRRHLAGDISSRRPPRCKTATRHPKRQMTWFKNQIIADKTLPAQYLKVLVMKSFYSQFFVDRLRLTSYRALRVGFCARTPGKGILQVDYGPAAAAPPSDLWSKTDGDKKNHDRCGRNYSFLDRSGC